MTELENIDPLDMAAMVAAFPEMLRVTIPKDDFINQAAHLRDQGIHGICLIGMGGSAIAGDMCKALLADKADLPIVTARDYIIPRAVDHQWAIIAVSYSGNTEETIAAFQEANTRGCSTFVVTTGGVLERIGNKARTLILPGGIQPRAALPIIFSGVLPLMETLLDLKPSNLESISRKLETAAAEWESSGLTPDELASSLNHNVPLFIGWRHLAPVAYRAKCQINENSKSFALSSEIPEMNHNEIEGTSSCADLPLVPVFLRSQEEDERTKKRFSATSDIFAKGGCLPVHLELGLKPKILELLRHTMYLDTVSVKLAEIKGVNPVSVDRIAGLKRTLGG